MSRVDLKNDFYYAELERNQFELDLHENDLVQICSQDLSHAFQWFTEAASLQVSVISSSDVVKFWPILVHHRCSMRVTKNPCVALIMVGSVL